MDACKIAASDLLRLATLAATAPGVEADEVLDIVRRSEDLPDPAPAPELPDVSDGPVIASGVVDGATLVPKASPKPAKPE